MVDTEKTYSGLTDGCAAAGMERCRLVELVGDGANGDKIKRLINDGIDVRLLPSSRRLTTLAEMHTGSPETVPRRSQSASFRTWPPQG